MQSGLRIKITVKGFVQHPAHAGSGQDKGITVARESPGLFVNGGFRPGLQLGQPLLQG